MTTATKLKTILEILEKHGEGEHLVQADHDIIYLNSGDPDAPFAEDLKAAGASFGESEGWYIFV